MLTIGLASKVGYQIASRFTFLMFIPLLIFQLFTVYKYFSYTNSENMELTFYDPLRITKTTIIQSKMIVFALFSLFCATMSSSLLLISRFIHKIDALNSMEVIFKFFLVNLSLWFILGFVSVLLFNFHKIFPFIIFVSLLTVGFISSAILNTLNTHSLDNMEHTITKSIIVLNDTKPTLKDKGQPIYSKNALPSLDTSNTEMLVNEIIKTNNASNKGLNFDLLAKINHWVFTSTDFPKKKEIGYLIRKITCEELKNYTYEHLTLDFGHSIERLWYPQTSDFFAEMQENDYKIDANWETHFASKFEEYFSSISDTDLQKLNDAPLLTRVSSIYKYFYDIFNLDQNAQLIWDSNNEKYLSSYAKHIFWCAKNVYSEFEQKHISNNSLIKFPTVLTNASTNNPFEVMPDHLLYVYTVNPKPPIAFFVLSIILFLTCLFQEHALNILWKLRHHV